MALTKASGRAASAVKLQVSAMVLQATRNRCLSGCLVSSTARRFRHASGRIETSPISERMKTS